MADSKKQKKTVYYKRAEISPRGRTLQEYLEHVFTLVPRPSDRLEDLDDDGTIKRFINSHRSLYGMLFGQLMRYEPGKDQAVFVLDNESDEYPVETIGIPQNDDGKTREFIESVLYFGVLENHMVVLQSQSLKARDLESYLAWLLYERTKLIPTETIFCLSDQTTKSARKKIEEAHVRTVKIGAPLLSSVEKTDSTPEKKKKKNKQQALHFHPTGRGFDAIAAFLGPRWRKKIKLKDALDEANLRINMEITYIRKTTQSAHDVLDNIATSLRHLEPDDVQIELEGGGILKGSELKFSGKLDVMTYNGIISTRELYNEMVTWLKGRIGEGKIA